MSNNKAGGRAYKDGIMFHNDKYEVITKKTKDGGVKVTVSEFKESKYSFRKIEGIPFIRPYIFYFKMIIDGWKGLILTNIISISSILIITLLVTLSGNGAVLEKEYSSQFVSIVILLILAALFRFTKVSKYHGAEHMAIAALNNELEITNDNIANQSRISRFCGTNLVVFIFMIKIPLDFFGVHPLISLLIGISIGFELFLLNEGKLHTLLTPVYLVGYGLQKYLLTAKPDKEQLDIARIGISKLKELSK